MDNQPKPPLWREVITAWCLPPESWINQEGCRAANVILALTNWLVPEEAYPSSLVDEYEHAAWVQRYELRQTLLAEAARAEAGE